MTMRYSRLPTSDMGGTTIRKKQTRLVHLFVSCCKRNLAKLCLLFILVAILGIYLPRYYPSLFSRESSSITEKFPRELKYSMKKEIEGKTISAQLDLPHCIIPSVPKYTQSYSRVEVDMGSCEEVNEFSTLKNGVVLLKGGGGWRKCCVSEIIRPQILDDDSFEIGPCIPFNNSNTMKVPGKEFIRVSCENLRPEYNYHATINPKTDFLRRKAEYWNKKKKFPVNVLLLVLDSTSRTEAFRHLKNTMSYLLNHLDFVDYKGFHNLGEPTMYNAIPLLMGISKGKFEKEMKTNWEEKWDNFPFIWKEFDNSSYGTGFLEDLPYLGTFNYDTQTGFTNKPTDFYLRPFFLASGVDDYDVKTKCIGKTSLEKYLLDYQLEMLKKMTGVTPIFSISWLCWPQHSKPGGLHRLDIPLLNFFQSLKSEPNLLDNTLTIVMSDHAFYDDEFATKTHEGLLERRLPLFLIRVPENLIQEHPEFGDRVRENANRITSHFDVYKTLLHLARLSSPVKKSEEKQQGKPNFGKSFLEYIPEARTCQDAGIPKGICACNLPFPSGTGFTNSSILKKMAVYSD